MLPKSNPLPDTLVEQISNTLTKDDVVVEEVIIPKKRDRQGQINFSIPDDIKVNWKVLCDKNHLTLKQGITFAMEHLIQEIEDGEVLLTIGGVMKKRG